MSAILVAVTLLTKGHPTPRRRRPAEEPELGRFRCPAGSYLDSSVQMERSARLQAHVRAALARGLAPTALDAAPRALQNLSQQYTRESLAWPKPAYCRRRQAEVCSVSPHFCLALPSGNSPRASLISEKYRLEFRQVWKVASSSLASFFFCNMWGDLKLRKVMPGTPPPAQGARIQKPWQLTAAKAAASAPKKTPRLRLSFPRQRAARGSAAACSHDARASSRRRPRARAQGMGTSSPSRRAIPLGASSPRLLRYCRRPPVLLRLWFLYVYAQARWIQPPLVLAHGGWSTKGGA